ncbi:MAG TPA: hypothetical protein PKA83_19805, partial [Pirellulaceae bacterium]|nr:hypothetical protein [Pirellulaceae bacterium]
MNRFIPLTLSLFCLLASTASAQTTYHWLNTSGGSYHTAGNWTPAGGPPLVNDSARFSLNQTYTVTFGNNGTQTKDFQVRGGNVTFQYFGTTAHHFWGGSSTNYVGPQSGDAATSATLNLTNMFNNPMMGHHLVVGNTAGKTGTLNIHGNGWWKGYATSDVLVGTLGTGNLNISTVGIAQKSLLEAFNIALGHSGGTGVGTVSGLNASMTANNILTVGQFANSLGSLTISNQGKVNVGQSLYVGVSSDKDNAVTVTGDGSELVLGSQVTRIGFGGKGRLWVLDGGKVTNTSSLMEIGSLSGGQGALAVSGSGSHFNSTGNQILSVGTSAQGDLDIVGGGKVDVHRLSLGTENSGVGKLVVSGNGSVLNLNGAGINYIGEQGTGQATVSNGGQINAAGALAIGGFHESSLTIQSGGKVFSQAGYVGGPSGLSGSSVTVTGDGSLWSNTFGVDVGSTQSTELNVLNGGQVISSGGRLGLFTGSQGTVTVSGNGSHWDVGNDGLLIGQSGQGTLSILNGGTVTNKNVSVGVNSVGSGVVKVSGPDATWNVNGLASIGNSGNGTLIVENGAKMFKSIDADLRVGMGDTAVGVMKVTGSGSEVSIGGGAPFGPILDIGVFGTGTLEVTNGGLIYGGGGRLGG